MKSTLCMYDTRSVVSVKVKAGSERERKAKLSEVQGLETGICLKLSPTQMSARLHMHGGTELDARRVPVRCFDNAYQVETD